MTKLWRCTPTQFAEQPLDMIDLHIGIYNLEIKQQEKEQKRLEQQQKQARKNQ